MPLAILLASYPVQGIIEPDEMPLDGWQSLSAYTLQYVSASSLRFVGDVTSILAIGDKLKFDNATTKYFYVVSFSFAAGFTTVNVTAGNVYTVANLPISNAYLSKMETPNGFPDVFTWTPTLTGFSTNPSSITAVFCLKGRVCNIWFSTNQGTSNATTLTVSLPIPVASGVPSFDLAASVQNNGAFQATPGRFSIAASGTAMSATLSWAATGDFTNSGNKRASAIQTSYII